MKRATVSRIITICVSDSPLNITNGESIIQSRTTGMWLTEDCVKDCVITGISEICGQMISQLTHEDFIPSQMAIRAKDDNK